VGSEQTLATTNTAADYNHPPLEVAEGRRRK